MRKNVKLILWMILTIIASSLASCGQSINTTESDTNQITPTATIFTTITSQSKAESALPNSSGTPIPSPSQVSKTTDSDFELSLDNSLTFKDSLMVRNKYSEYGSYNFATSTFVPFDLDDSMSAEMKEHTWINIGFGSVDVSPDGTKAFAVYKAPRQQTLHVFDMTLPDPNLLLSLDMPHAMAKYGPYWNSSSDGLVFQAFIVKNGDFNYGIYTLNLEPVS